MCAPSTENTEVAQKNSDTHGSTDANGSQPSSQSISKRASEPVVVDPDAEYFAGIIKSYNTRRGFGFLACEDTARRWGRDVYLSKIESQAAIAQGEEDLKEGDHVQFAVFLNFEGFPQAIGVQRLQMVKGKVLAFSSSRGGVIACEEAHFFGGREVKVQPNDCGCLMLYPGDEVAFVLEASADDAGSPEARLVQLASAASSSNGILGCFFVEFPRLVVDPREPRQAFPVDVLLIGHGLGNRICLAGLPYDMGENELDNFFGKYGAVHVSVVRSVDGFFASVEFNEVNDVARLLAGGAHAFTVPGMTLLARFNRRCSSNSGATLPALHAPGLVQREDGALLAWWSPLGIASAYRVEIRATGARGWSDVDPTGRVQPAGAAPLLSAQNQCLMISGLCAGMSYEARVSYVSTCGCSSQPSDASPPCSTSVTQPVCSHVGPSAPQPPTLINTSACNVMTRQQYASSVIQPGSPVRLQPAVMMPPTPCSRAMHSLGTVMMPTAGVPGAQCNVLAPPQSQPITTCKTLLQQPCCPISSTMKQGSEGCCIHGAPLPKAPALNQVLPVDGNNAALSVQWRSTDNLATGFSVELREGGATCSERFARPNSGFAGILELCIAGLNPGRGYMACVYAVSQCGCESAASMYSSWVTLPGDIEESLLESNVDASEQNHTSEEQNVGEKVDLSDQNNSPPEVTGCENALLHLD